MSDDVEGVIKFRLEHTPGPEPEHAELASLLKARNDLHRLGLIGVAQGIGYGNVSVRGSRTGDVFIISGSGTGALTSLGPEACCSVTGYDIARNRIQSFGPVPASSESLTHAAVYAANADVHCVIHVHSMALYLGLLEAGTPATPAHVAYGTPEMALAVGKLALCPGAIMVMKGHVGGVLAFGGSCAETYQTVIAAMRRISEQGV